MALLLSIDTATETAGIYLAKNGLLLGGRTNSIQQDHAAWIHPALQALLNEFGYTPPMLDAISVTIGPGSYTGIRVGLATAKGLSYALNRPMITETTLKLLAATARNQFSKEFPISAPDYYCALIDARRMEVFTAVYDKNLETVLEPQALVLEPDQFLSLAKQGQVAFIGSGAAKWQKHCNYPGGLFENFPIDGETFSRITYDKFLTGEFTAPAYIEPAYLKEFYTHPKK